MCIKRAGADGILTYFAKRAAEWLAVSASMGSEAPDQYGVAGHPIAHSWSPFIHGMFAKATAQNLVYRLFDIPPENFRREALRLFAGGLKGLNVTLPHKQAAAELVNELTPRAERARPSTPSPFSSRPRCSATTPTAGIDGRSRDQSRDRACRQTRAYPGRRRRGSRRARPLLERELHAVVIANRTPERARKLAAEFADLGEIHGCGFVASGKVRPTISSSTPPPRACRGRCRCCRRVSSARKASATTWPMGAGTPPLRCGRNPCMPRAPPRAGACW